jgi:N-methylhydantoinase A
MPVRVPVIELLEIGAGGGSIASLDDVGLLAVGPESAASTPGPACYGRQGTRPTVTDADLILGYLDPDYFLGGKITLDRAASERAIAAEVGAAFGGAVVDAAVGIVTVVEESMAAAMRIHATEGGRDPRDYTLFAFGGAAPVHAARVARRIGIGQVIVPAAAGVLAASGLQVAPPTIDVSRTLIMPVGAWDPLVVKEICDDLKARALEQLGPLAGDHVTCQLSVDMRFRYQGYEIEVPLPELSRCMARGEALSDATEADRLFRERYEAMRGSVPPAADAEIVAWRLSATGRWEEPVIAALRPERAGVARDGVDRRRSAWFESTGVTSVPVVRHVELSPGDRYEGPVIVQQPESTVVVGPGDLLVMDADTNLRLTINLGESS